MKAITMGTVESLRSCFLSWQQQSTLALMRNQGRKMSQTSMLADILWVLQEQGGWAPAVSQAAFSCRNRPLIGLHDINIYWQQKKLNMQYTTHIKTFKGIKQWRSCLCYGFILLFKAKTSHDCCRVRLPRRNIHTNFINGLKSVFKQALHSNIRGSSWACHLNFREIEWACKYLCPWHLLTLTWVHNSSSTNHTGSSF